MKQVQDMTHEEFCISLFKSFRHPKLSACTLVFDEKEIISTVGRIKEIFKNGDDDKLTFHGIRVKDEFRQE